MRLVFILVSAECGGHVSTWPWSNVCFSSTFHFASSSAMTHTHQTHKHTCLGVCGAFLWFLDKVFMPLGMLVVWKGLKHTHIHSHTDTHIYHICQFHSPRLNDLKLGQNLQLSYVTRRNGQQMCHRTHTHTLIHKNNRDADVCLVQHGCSLGFTSGAEVGRHAGRTVSASRTTLSDSVEQLQSIRRDDEVQTRRRRRTAEGDEIQRRMISWAWNQLMGRSCSLMTQKLSQHCTGNHLSKHGAVCPPGSPGSCAASWGSVNTVVSNQHIKKSYCSSTVELSTLIIL